MMEILNFDNVTYQYSRHDEQSGETIKHTALSEINLTVRKGEFIAVLGHNGSGKSTLAKLINALLFPTDGTVTVNGMLTSDENNIYAVRKTAGMVFQNPDNQLIASVVEEDTAFGPQNLGLPPNEIKERVRKALAAVGMSEYAKNPTFALSGGQKQKTAIAGVLAMEPEIIILDEPTAMLDPIGRKDVIQTTERLNKEKGITVIFITHFMHEAIAAQRSVVLSKGRIVRDASSREVLADADFLREFGLDAPQVPDLADKLRKNGVKIPENIITIPEMKEALLSCLRQGT